MKDIPLFSILILIGVGVGSAIKCYRCIENINSPDTSADVLRKLGYTTIIPEDFCTGTENDLNACAPNISECLLFRTDFGVGATDSLLVYGCEGDLLSASSEPPVVLDDVTCRDLDGREVGGVTMHCTTCSKDGCNRKDHGDDSTTTTTTIITTTTTTTNKTITVTTTNRKDEF